MAITHTSEIKLKVGLDENRIPEELHWSAEDGGITEEAAKAMLLSVWDSKNKESLKIDLWTKDMPVEEMKMFFHQTLLTLADTFYRATQDEKMTANFREFCQFFAQELELDKPASEN